MLFVWDKLREVVQVKLTDEMRKKIIADYVDCENYSAVARKYGVSRTTVSNIVNNDSAICEKLKKSGKYTELP